jgi:type II secretory pathway pseudopilin PulG
MGGLSTVLLVLAILCAAIGVVLMMAMTSAVRARGQQINWLFLRLFVLKYVSDYRYLTIKETGHCGPLFYPFVISMNLALLFTIIGLVLL